MPLWRLKMSSLNQRIRDWVGECLRKKKLRKDWAENIIQRAKKEGTDLYSYYCPHCTKYHVTKSQKYKNKDRF